MRMNSTGGITNMNISDSRLRSGGWHPEDIIDRSWLISFSFKLNFLLKVLSGFLPSSVL